MRWIAFSELCAAASTCSSRSAGLPNSFLGSLCQPPSGRPPWGQPSSGQQSWGQQQVLNSHLFDSRPLGQMTLPFGPSTLSSACCFTNLLTPVPPLFWPSSGFPSHPSTS
ncbi:hypothetical protein C1H46_018691 [Malus baccata]|uniref:Uncharacterized protein n=1 Tax=Malus baccata TaxID=106549 RepID=A0A540MAH5_MALBA|nr:hypothetical protein C1H46_018691 [Malus baccata]